jgi:GTPase
VIGLNKADLCDSYELRKIEEQARDKLAFCAWAPIVQLSARTGDGTAKLLRTLQKVATSSGQRVPTGELNRFFEQVLATHPPPTKGGRAPRFYYVAQPGTAPPRFVVQASHPESIHFSYQRYVVNAIRKRFGFEGVPVRVEYRRPGRHKKH